MKKNHPYKGLAGSYEAAPVPLPEPEPVVEVPPEPIHSSPVVIREGNGWSVVQLTFQGLTIIERKKVHGPNLRRICNAMALRIMENS